MGLGLRHWVGCGHIGALTDRVFRCCRRWTALWSAAGVQRGPGGAFLLVVVWTGSYRRVERVAIALGLFEFAFFWVAIAAHPRAHDLAAGLVHAPLSSPAYLYLVSANIGAVIMPWMIFYQQSAIADKG